MLQKHNMKIADYEFRTCDKYLIRDGELIKAEIVRWDYEYCYTILVFDYNDNYWSSREVGNRLVDCISDLDFQELFKYAHKYLEDNTTDRYD